MMMILKLKRPTKNMETIEETHNNNNRKEKVLNTEKERESCDQSGIV